MQECVCVCVSSRQDSTEGGGYPFTASGRQTYSTGMSHMQCDSTPPTHNTRRVCVCAAVHGGVSVVFVSEVCIAVCVSDSP